ncbi:MAG: hypothetical protein EU536_05025 [Promethearchaeota archaeon]|nr:MAG: hypothetical protein EU536_05025 [Candidatus Lokiarchaeota archaeon]
MQGLNRFILDLLRLSKDQEEIALEKLVLDRDLSESIVLKLLQHLRGELGAVIQVKDKEVYVPKATKMKLVEKALQESIDLDEIIKTLHWRDFESFCLRVLDYHEFCTTLNLHFSINKKRYEIDVIGIRRQLILAIDAKKWKTGRSSALKVMVRNQIDRCKALAQSLGIPKIRDQLNLTKDNDISIIPMLVTSKMYEIAIFQRVPIVPFFKFNQFLTDFHLYAEAVYKIPSQYTIPRPRVSKPLTEFFKSAPKNLRHPV